MRYILPHPKIKKRKKEMKMKNAMITAVTAIEIARSEIIEGI